MRYLPLMLYLPEAAEGLRDKLSFKNLFEIKSQSILACPLMSIATALDYCIVSLFFFSFGSKKASENKY